MITKNKGSATVEACFVVPIFLFFMLAVGEFIMLMLAEAHIHQSLAEAADYTAQYCYLERKIFKESQGRTGGIINTVILKKQFNDCLGEDFYVKKMIRNGKKGILISIKMDEENNKIFRVRASYFASILLPVLGNYSVKLSDTIEQKAFVGYGAEEKAEIYVYITPNQEVYHKRRGCSHLSLSVKEIGINEKRNYTACRFCGRGENADGVIYVSKTSRIFHYRKDCSGLKRTVSRIKITETGGLGPCKRCGE